MRARPAAALRLEGDAGARGRGQAAAEPGMAGAVRRAVRGRLAQARDRLARPQARAWLDAQRDFTERHAPAALAELRGLAEGFEIAEAELLVYLHLGVVADLAGDGCTAWAAARTKEGPLLAKNRDFRGEHAALQRVFLHRDPAWRGREILTIGSLGSPGVYSSGINSDGLALADTHVATSDHGPGWLRYFLMTELLAGCATVAEALDRIAAVPHAGGGSLVLADRTGAVAAVELGHRRIAIDPSPCAWVARTNHFVAAALAAAGETVVGDDPMAATSRRRLATIRAALAAAGEAIDAAAAGGIMAMHTDKAHEGLCRHGEDGDARTISTALYAPGTGSLTMSEGPPCRDLWRRYTFDGTAAADTRPRPG